MATAGPRTPVEQSSQVNGRRLAETEGSEATGTDWQRTPGVSTEISIVDRPGGSATGMTLPRLPAEIGTARALIVT
jgi:hypothetical protein